jgi:hypothetical protein
MIITERQLTEGLSRLQVKSFYSLWGPAVSSAATWTSSALSPYTARFTLVVMLMQELIRLAGDAQAPTNESELQRHSAYLPVGFVWLVVLGLFYGSVTRCLL